ncbi:ornithine cyclodeaminase family protein, partial [Acinetobacter baumannii]
GAGGQAEFEARAIARRRRLKQIRIGARKPESGERLAAALSDLGAEIEVCTIEGAVRDAEIIVTVTPAREPLVMSGWVRAGAHISAMGADA